MGLGKKELYLFGTFKIIAYICTQVIKPTILSININSIKMMNTKKSLFVMLASVMLVVIA
jgi:hypothetical protein